MGFDDASSEGDTNYELDGIKVIISAGSDELLQNTTLDYVELDEGSEKQFIFLNPNDPNYSPPK
jgi:Fe-S cluster assembly iron-binding protein IscA